MPLLRGRGLRRRFPRFAQAFDRLTRAQWRRLQLCTFEGIELWVDPQDHGVARPLLTGDAYEPEETAAILRLLPQGATFLDVGANIGVFTTLASRAVGPGGLVIAFEPDPANRAILIRNLHRNRCANVEVERVALSDRAGVTEFFRDLSNHGHHRIFPIAGGSRPIRVRTARLDDVVDRERPIDLVKIDVEGAEVLAISGMAKVIDRWRDRIVLLVELAPENLVSAGHDPNALLDRLEGLGLSLFGLDGRAVDRETLLERARPAGYTNLLASARIDLDERLNRGSEEQIPPPASGSGSVVSSLSRS